MRGANAGRIYEATLGKTHNITVDYTGKADSFQVDVWANPGFYEIDSVTVDGEEKTSFVYDGTVKSYEIRVKAVSTSQVMTVTYVITVQCTPEIEEPEEQISEPPSN